MVYIIYYIHLHSEYISWVRYDQKWDSPIGQILPQAPEVPSHFCHPVLILEDIRICQKPARVLDIYIYYMI